MFLPYPNPSLMRNLWELQNRSFSMGMEAMEVIFRRSLGIAAGVAAGDMRHLPESSRMVSEKMAVLPEMGMAAWQGYMRGLASGTTLCPVALHSACLSPMRRRVRANAKRLRRVR